MSRLKSRFIIDEVDLNSRTSRKSYVLSSTSPSQDETIRIDELPQQLLRVHDRDQLVQEGSRSRQDEVYSGWTVLWTVYVYDYLKVMFLPTGYPHSVTEDYTWYQIYDSIQAFASSIAGLLSSRAVLQSFRIEMPAASSDGEDTSSRSVSVATAATLVSILQNTLANATSILFASYAAPHINRDVKFYRFLADVVNDVAFVLDLLAPMLPDSISFDFMPLLSGTWTSPLTPRTMALCASSMLRAVCGVAGGSSKAVLSTHFARNNPEAVGDLQAKDSSQETVINLLGIWFGGYLVSKVEGLTATWCWMLGLLSLHLLANYRAVKSIRLRSLNAMRASLVMPGICKALSSVEQDRRATLRIPKSLSVESIGQKESILGLRVLLSRVWSFSSRHTLKTCQIRVGVNLQRLLRFNGSDSRSDTESWTMHDMDHLFTIFDHEAYVLWLDTNSSEVTVALKRHAEPQDQFKALLHGWAVHYLFGTMEPIDKSRKAIFSQISRCLSNINAEWPEICSEFQELGWDLSLTDVDKGRGLRIDIRSQVDTTAVK